MIRVTRRQAMLEAKAAGTAQFPGGGCAQDSRAGFKWAAGGQGSVNAASAPVLTQVLRQTGFEMFAVNSGGIRRLLEGMQKHNPARLLAICDQMQREHLQRAPVAVVRKRNEITVLLRGVSGLQRGLTADFTRNDGVRKG